MNKVHTIFIIGLLFMSFVLLDNSQPYNSINKHQYSNIKLYDLKNEASLKLVDVLDSNLNVLIFHSIDCPFNRAYQSRLDTLQKDFSNDSVAFVYVNSNVSEKSKIIENPKMVDFISTHSSSYLLDNTRKIERILNSVNHTSIKNGTSIVCQLEQKKLKIYYIGPIDETPQKKYTNSNGLLKSAIESALINQPTNNDSIINTGCRIINH